MGPHRWVVGPRRVDRLRWVTAEYEPDIVARCHRRLRGPYTGEDTVLSEVLPLAQSSWPELVERHRFALLYGISELEAIIGPTPATLAGESPFEERTRYFGSALIRVISQGIVSFLIEYARRRDGAPLRLFFDEVDQGDPTTQEFIAILVRRADPDRIQVSVGSATDAVGAELSGALSAHGTTVDVVAGVAPAVGPAGDLARRYVCSDGTSDDPAELAAYAAADPALVARLHDERADELEPGAGRGIRIGALAYHREHGSDPTGTGRLAINAAFQRCVEIGFSAAIIDLGERGRALTDPQVFPRDFANLVNHAASALVADGRTDETEALLADLRQRFTDPKVHMLASYTMAMLHTRFLRPRNHDRALQWQNNAIAIASLLPDPADRLVYGVFQDNALALIEMHRGNLAHALDLVQAGMTRLDGSLRDDQWRVHRSQHRGLHHAGRHGPQLHRLPERTGRRPPSAGRPRRRPGRLRPRDRAGSAVPGAVLQPRHGAAGGR
jgi:hypothetical protein